MTWGGSFGVNDTSSVSCCGVIPMESLTWTWDAEGNSGDSLAWATDCAVKPACSAVIIPVGDPRATEFPFRACMDFSDASGITLVESRTLDDGCGGWRELGVNLICFMVWFCDPGSRFNVSVTLGQGFGFLSPALKTVVWPWTHLCWFYSLMLIQCIYRHWYHDLVLWLWGYPCWFYDMNIIHWSAP